MIALDLTEKRFGARVILGPMALRVTRGEVLGIGGASGVGKTTLLRILAGLDTRFSGRLEASGRRAMVFQEPCLMPWRSVIDNVMIPTGVSRGAAAQILVRVGLGAMEGLWPTQLSLGQQRRVALARAFVGTPEILVMDEPFASLDHARIGDLLTLTAELLAEVRPAVVLVSHAEAELAALSTRRVWLTGTPAQLAADQRVLAGS